jgi:hypothetical protein
MICCSIGQIDLYDWIVIDERRLKQHVVRMCVLPMKKNEKDTSIQYKLRLVYTWIDIKLYNKQET